MLPESEIIGRKNGKLTIESFSHKNEHGRRIWNCRCECGNSIPLPHAHFVKQVTCGCFDKDRPTERWKKHGMTHTSEWSIWHGIRKRCLCPTDQAYPRYGGRGVGLCKEWTESFEAFYRDMGPRPAGKTVDRIDNNKGYSKENCRWVDWKTQSRNKRTNHLLTVDGVTKCITEWAEQTGIRKDTLRRRIMVYGWTPEEAIKTKTMRKFTND